MFLVWHCCRRSHKPACKQQAQAHLRVNITPSWMSKAQCSWVQAPPSNGPHASQINVNAKHTGLFIVKIQVQCILYSVFCCSLCWLSTTCVMTPVRLCYVAFKLCQRQCPPNHVNGVVSLHIGSQNVSGPLGLIHALLLCV